MNFLWICLFWIFSLSGIIVICLASLETTGEMALHLTFSDQGFKTFKSSRQHAAWTIRCLPELFSRNLESAASSPGWAKSQLCLVRAALHRARKDRWPLVWACVGMRRHAHLWPLKCAEACSLVTQVLYKDSLGFSEMIWDLFAHLLALLQTSASHRFGLLWVVWNKPVSNTFT